MGTDAQEALCPRRGCVCSGGQAGGQARPCLHLLRGSGEPANSTASLICQKHTGKFPQVPGQEYTEELYKKDLHDPDNHDGVITDLEPDILECEVKWALESIHTQLDEGPETPGCW